MKSSICLFTKPRRRSRRAAVFPVTRPLFSRKVKTAASQSVGELSRPGFFFSSPRYSGDPLTRDNRAMAGVEYFRHCGDSSPALVVIGTLKGQKTEAHKQHSYEACDCRLCWGEKLIVLSRGCRWATATELIIIVRKCKQQHRHSYPQPTSSISLLLALLL